MTPADITNLYDLKENNIAQVLRNICTTENCSRVSLAHSTGLKQATITKIVNKLLAWGIVSEDVVMSSPSAGRKPMRLLVNAVKYIVIAVRLERTTITLAALDIGGSIHYQSSSVIVTHSRPQDVMDKLKAMIHSAIQTIPSPPMAIGIAVPGPINRTKSRIMLMSSFPGWTRLI